MWTPSFKGCLKVGIVIYCRETKYCVSAVRGARPGRNVMLTESEIRGLCLKCREIFLEQLVLLELEAPMKICGELHNNVWFQIEFTQVCNSCPSPD